MRRSVSHEWDVSPTQAVRIQLGLRHKVVVRAGGPFYSVGGLDAHDGRGAVAVFTLPDLRWLTGAVAERTVTFPYVPGLLSFREMPLLLAAIERLDFLPDLFMCDGHGLAHPRRFGVACHLGVWLEHPTLGCAKSRLCGHYEPPSGERGSSSLLYDGSEVIGAVVRTQDNTRPVYVSAGHLIELREAIEVVLRCAPHHRLPEPLRYAHMMAKAGRILPLERASYGK